MAQEKFYEILVKELEVKIRADLIKEFHSDEVIYQKAKISEVFSVQPEMTSLSFIKPKYFYAKTNIYPRSRKPCKTSSSIIQAEPAEAPVASRRDLTAEEWLNFEVFLGLGAELSENFSERDLKREFRKLALKYHPDHQLQPNLTDIKRFNDAKSCYDNLCKSLEK